MKRLPLIVGSVFVVALAVLLPQLKPDQNPDYYREMGRNVLAGKGFVAVAPNGRELPNVLRPPLYPLFLAGVMAGAGDRVGVLLVANCVLAALGCALTVVAAARWLSGRGALVAGLIVALDPSSVIRCSTVMAEMLFTLLVLAGVCVLAWRREKTWAWWLAGVCWALAALTRTIAIVLPVVALAGLVLWRQRWQSGAVFLAGFLPLIGLWVARNALLTGHAFYSTAGGNVLVTGWAALSEAEHSGESTSTMHQKLLARAGATEFYDGAAAFARRQSEQGHLLRELAQVNPVQLAGDLARGAGQNLLGPGARTLEPYLQRPRPARPWWPPVYTTALAVVLGLAVWGAVRRWRDLTLLTVLVVCFVVPSAQPTPNSRYRYPILPLLAILAVAGVSAPRRDHVHHGH